MLDPDNGFDLVAGGKAAGRAVRDAYTANHYHQPSDEYHASMDFRGNARMAQFGFLLGWQASEAAKPITWQPGDEFLKTRQASQTGQ